MVGWKGEAGVKMVDMRGGGGNKIRANVSQRND